MWINKGEVDKLKCFDYDCTKEISDANLRQILTQLDADYLMDKYERFKK